MYSIKNVLDIQVGKELEDEFINWFSKFVSCKRASLEEDIYKGTDLFIEGISVDVTFNADNKDHIVMRRKYNDDWSLAIRIGNNHNGGTLFEEPVVVVGYNCDDPKYMREWVIPRIGTYIGSVRAMADAIADIYCAYDDMVNS